MIDVRFRFLGLPEVEKNLEGTPQKARTDGTESEEEIEVEPDNRGRTSNTSRRASKTPRNTSVPVQKQQKLILEKKPT